MKLRESPRTLSCGCYQHRLTRPAHIPIVCCCVLQEVPDAIGSLSSLTCLEVDMNCDASELLPSLHLPANLTSIRMCTSMLHL
jgi:hypothetical protein